MLMQGKELANTQRRYLLAIGGGEKVNIKYIGKNTAKLEHGKVHKIENLSKTGCGAVYSDNPQDWQYTNEPVTCNKNGCKN